VRLVFMAVLALGLVACGLVVVSGAARRLAWHFARRHGVWCGLAGVCLSWLGGAAFSCGF
jgi:H+/gluconate symporter-like permease